MRNSTLDVKLQLFRLLKDVPFPRLRTKFRRKYYGRLRAYSAIDIEEVFAKLPAKPTIVDLGANQECFLPTNLMQKAGEIHAVEPDPLVFEKLRANLAVYDNVFLYNAAVGADDGLASFYRQAGFDSQNPVINSLGSSVFSRHEAVNPARAIVVPQMGILTLLEKIGKRVDLMKMDIEGAEVPVLEALLESPHAANVSVILVETHEHVLPDLVDRTDALRQRVKRLDRPKIDMSWH